MNIINCRKCPLENCCPVLLEHQKIHRVGNLETGFSEPTSICYDSFGEYIATCKERCPLYRVTVAEKE